MEIKDLLQTKAWQEIENIFLDEIDKMKRDINTKDKDVAEIGKQYIARREAEKIVLNALNKVRRYGKELKTSDISYK